MTLLRKLSQAKIPGSVALLGCVAVLFSIAFDGAYAAREVSENRECATCHVMWLKEFKQKEITPLIPYNPKPVVESGKQDVSSTEKMCFSCHDGFVLDSRFMWKDKSHAHPVGVKPSHTMRIPTSKGKTIFPLNDDGRVYCGTCHSAHGVDWKDEKSPIFLRVRNVDSSMCLACHLQKGEGTKQGNHPIFKKSQHGSENLLLAGSRFSEDGSVICETCHRSHGAEYDTMLVKDNQDSGLCQTCHKKQSQLIGSKHDMSLVAPEVKNKKGKTYQESGPCGVCHTPHAGKGAAALWARKIPQNTPDRAAAACLECHNSNGVAKEKGTGEHSHPQMRSLSQLGIETSKKAWLTQHSLAKGEQSLQILPLFNRYGKRDPQKGQVSCATCHDPHTWTTLEPTANVADETELHRQEGDGDSSFLRIAQGKRSALCLNCHLDQRALAGTPHDPALIKTALKSNEEGQEEEPEQANKQSYDKGFCETCHQAHNAKGANLRARNAGPGKLYTETWCRDCHRKEGLAKDKAVAGHSHPLGVKPKTLEANSKLPLFSSDGAYTKLNGVIDCATCHDPHIWTTEMAKSSYKQGLTGANDKSTKQDKPEGDAHSSFLRITAAGDAPLCTECHSEQGLVRGTDHDLRVTGTTSTNAQGQSIEQSGICGQCHAMHDSVLKNKLWALKPGEANEVVAQQCASCHVDTGIAKDKVPPELEHPEKAVAWSNDSRNVYYNNKQLPVITVYDEKGAIQRMGTITCTSCHNPHQWNPGATKAGSGKNEEGDVLTSFLRNKNSEYIVCADCHGKDALFRYKYYHSKTSRIKHPLYR